MRFQDLNQNELQVACCKNTMLFSITKEDSLGDVEEILEVELSKEQAIKLANYILKVTNN